jgi:hypothetical protein
MSIILTLDEAWRIGQVEPLVLDVEGEDAVAFGTSVFDQHVVNHR